MSAALAAGGFVTFRLAGREYALPAADVVELTPAVTVTPVPGGARRLAGVTTWRGRTIPVVDPRALLKRGAPPPDVGKSRLLVLRHPGPFGVLIGEPGRILREGEVQPVETARDGSGPQAERVRLLRAQSGFVRLLDPEQLVGEEGDLLAEIR